MGKERNKNEKNGLKMEKEQKKKGLRMEKERTKNGKERN